MEALSELKRLQVNFGDMLGRDTDDNARRFSESLFEIINKLTDYHRKLVVDWLLENIDSGRGLSIAKLYKAINFTREKASTKYYHNEGTYAKNICSNCYISSEKGYEKHTGLQRVLITCDNKFYNAVEPCPKCEYGKKRADNMKEYQPLENETIIARLSYPSKIVKDNSGKEWLDFDLAKNIWLSKYKPETAGDKAISPVAELPIPANK